MIPNNPVFNLNLRCECGKRASILVATKPYCKKCEPRIPLPIRIGRKARRKIKEKEDKLKKKNGKK